VTRIVVRALWGLGLLVAATAVLTMIVLGVSGYFDLSMCDPANIDCVTIIDGPAGGESPGSDRFDRGLASLLFIVTMLFSVSYGIRWFAGVVRRPPRGPTRDP
jgi:hypothetical protein